MCVRFNFDHLPVIHGGQSNPLRNCHNFQKLHIRDAYVPVNTLYDLSKTVSPYYVDTTSSWLVTLWCVTIDLDCSYEGSRPISLRSLVGLPYLHQESLVYSDQTDSSCWVTAMGSGLLFSKDFFASFFPYSLVGNYTYSPSLFEDQPIHSSFSHSVPEPFVDRACTWQFGSHLQSSEPYSFGPFILK